MQTFHYINNQLFAEGCALTAIAEQYGTPCYVYSRDKITRNWQAFDEACSGYPHQICYAVKANSNLAVLNVLARLGSGFDIVSVGELQRVLAAGGQANNVIFSGVGKQAHEIAYALEAGIGCFNIESIAELIQLNTLAKSLNKTASIALRINPDIPIQTHPYIATGLKTNKFGIPLMEAKQIYLKASQLSHIHIKGIACHLGSQILEIEPYLIALTMLLQLIDELADAHIHITHLDLGGGFGIDYTEKEALSPYQYLQPIIAQLKNRSLTLIIEPGRAIVANAGVLLTTILTIKNQSEKNFAIVDAGMNDLIRPALYAAWHDIVPVIKKTADNVIYDIVGPVCESGDFMAKDRALACQPNDLLAVTMAGAYGFVMSSNYNSRPRAAEIMVDGEKSYLIRARETVESLMATETCLP